MPANPARIPRQGVHDTGSNLRNRGQLYSFAIFSADPRAAEGEVFDLDLPNRALTAGEPTVDA
jgi:hypothetical protein